MILSIIGIILLIISSIPYIIYLKRILSKQIESESIIDFKNLPHVDIVVNTFQNCELIVPKLKNIYKTTYPDFKVFVINDGMDKETIKEFQKISYKNCELINHTERLGKTKCINDFLSKTKSEFVIFSDVDTFTRKDTFSLLISELTNDNVGAVCADVLPAKSCGSESNYRSVYGRMCIYDSQIDSTFNFNGQLIAVKKSVVNEIPLIGADDANIAFQSIISGKQSKYVQNAKCYELTPESTKESFKQKIRRANGLINSVKYYKKYVNNNRKFWKFTYDVRKFMLRNSPLCLFAGLLFVVIDFPLLIIPILLIQLIPMVKALFFNNLCLLIGSLNRKNIQKWDKIKLTSPNQ